MPSHLILTPKMGVPLHTILSTNALLRSTHPSPTAVFVGATVRDP